MMEPLLKIEGLSKRYPGFCLDGVSFSLAPGRIMGLIGKNGAGKSTTLKAMLNMVSPQSGRVTTFGRDFYRHEEACRQRVGVVFGGIDFYPLKKALHDHGGHPQVFCRLGRGAAQVVSPAFFAG